VVFLNRLVFDKIMIAGKGTSYNYESSLAGLEANGSVEELVNIK